MFDKVEFNVQMTRAGMNQQKLADAMGINLSTINRKIALGTFRRNEIEKLIHLLKIETPSRLYEIFFAHDLREHKNSTQGEKA